MPIKTYKSYNQYKAGGILLTANSLLSCSLKFDKKYKAPQIFPLSGIHEYTNVNPYIESYYIGYNTSNTRILSSLSLSATNSKVTINNKTGAISISSTALGTDSFRLFGVTRNLSTYNIVVLDTVVPITTLSGLRLYSNVFPQTGYISDIRDLPLKEVDVLSRGNASNWLQSFNLVYVKESYTELDNILAKYTGLPDKFLASGLDLEHLILSKDTDTSYSWKIVKGAPEGNNFTVLYTLSTNFTIANPLNLEGDLQDFADPFYIPNFINSNSSWVPATSSYQPIDLTFALPFVDNSYLELPVINNPQIIFVDDRSSLATFRIDASNMSEMHLGWLSETITKYKVDDLEGVSNSKISSNIYVDPDTGLVFANKLKAGGTFIRISATNKNGTVSKIVKVVIGSYEQGSSNFSLISSSKYKVSDLFAAPEIDHIINAQIGWVNNSQQNRTLRLKFANKKPSTSSENYLATTYLPIQEAEYNLSHDWNFNSEPQSDIFVEIPNSSIEEYFSREYPFIRKFDVPVEFGPNRQLMYWGIVASSSNINRTKSEWRDEPVPYIFVNPINSNTIPVSGWLKPSSSSSQYFYFTPGDPGTNLSAFYSSNTHISMFGSLSTASNLISAGNLTLSNEYYAYSEDLFVQSPNTAETIKNARVKINTDVDLIQNYDSFEYTNSYIIDTKIQELSSIMFSFWNRFTSTAGNTFTLPNLPNLYYKYSNNTALYNYTQLDTLQFYSKFLTDLRNTELALNFAVLLDGKAWLTTSPSIENTSVRFINVGERLAGINTSQTSVYNSYDSLPTGQNRLKELYWSNSNAYPRIIGNINGIGHFGPLSTKCYWGIQNSVSSFYAVNPNYNNYNAISSLEFPISGWLTSQNKSSFRPTFTYIALSSAPILTVDSSLNPKFYYCSIQSLPRIRTIGSNLSVIEHGKALVFRGNITPSDFKSSQTYLNKSLNFNINYIASDPMVAYGTDTRFGKEHVAALIKLGYL